MKTKRAKRVICLILSIMMALSALVGCQTEPDVSTDPPVVGDSEQDTTPSETLGPTTQGTVEPTAEEQINGMEIADSWKQELLLAAYIGLPMGDLEKETITGAEMTVLLDALVGYAVPDKLESYQALCPVFRNSKKPLLRIDVVTALFLAVNYIGGEFMNYTPTLTDVDWETKEAMFTDDALMHTELFGDPSIFGEFDVGGGAMDHYGTAACVYNYCNPCPVDGDYPLALDENGSFQNGKNATYLDGVMAIARAAATAHPEMFEYSSSAEEQAILDAAEARKTAILNAESDWTVGEGGTVYYVSPNGDDSNDGLSPETAWKSLGKLNSAAVGELNCSAEQINTKEFPHYQWAAEHPEEWITLNPGDVVLFERGGLWRGGLITAEGVTYSAYGEGAKPEIWGSPENGSGAEKWSLLEGTDNVWIYYKEMQECGGILLNGEIVATKYAPFWDEDTGKWLDFGEKEYLTYAEAAACPEFDVKTMGDLRFFNDLQNITIDFPAWCWGKLYLRCDAGNPGEVYDSIEFFTGVDGWGRCVQVSENATLDNITVKYFGKSVDLADGATVRNCRVEYCGGIVQAYNKGGYTTIDDSGECAIVRCGECIAAGNSDTTVTNTYIAYAYDHGISVENGAAGWVEDPTQDYAHHNINISGNLLEYNGGGLLCAAWDALFAGLDIALFDDVYFTDNYVLYTGMGWSHANCYLDGYAYLSSAVIGVNPGNSGEVHLIDNVFFDCWDIGQLVYYEYYDNDKTAAEFRGNTYLTAVLARAADINHDYATDDGIAGDKRWLLTDKNLQKKLAEYLGETEAKVITKRLAFVSPE